MEELGAYDSNGRIKRRALMFWCWYILPSGGAGVITWQKVWVSTFRACSCFPKGIHFSSGYQPPKAKHKSMNLIITGEKLVRIHGRYY
jgi:hypothetical protein